MKRVICYADSVEDTLEIRVRDDESLEYAVRQLAEMGFISMRGPFSPKRLSALVETYDEVMSPGCGPNFNVGSTTTRMSNLLSFNVIFDDIFLHEPLLAICSRFFIGDFKLSSFLGRTLRPGTPAQALHADLPRDSEDALLLGFILMVDPFLRENGATRFVPSSHDWPSVPTESMVDTRAQHPNEHVRWGAAGTMIIFNAAIWHGHTANTTPHPRRSVQGYFVRRNARRGSEFRSMLPFRVPTRMSPNARHLLALDEDS